MVVRWRTCLVGEVFGKVVMARILLRPLVDREKGLQAVRRKIDWRLEEEKRGRALVQTLGSDIM